MSVALINASSGLTALWVLLAGLGFVIFILFPVRWAYHWLAVKTGSLDAGTPSTLMMTITIVMVLISGFYTDIIGIHAIFVSGAWPTVMQMGMCIHSMRRYRVVSCRV